MLLFVIQSPNGSKRVSADLVIERRSCCRMPLASVTDWIQTPAGLHLP